MRPAHGNAIEMLAIQDGLHLPPFFTGPSAAAVATRSAISSGLGSLRRRGESAGLSTGPAGTWTYTHRHALRIGAVALAAVIFRLLRPPDRRGDHHDRRPAASPKFPLSAGR